MSLVYFEKKCCWWWFVLTKCRTMILVLMEVKVKVFHSLLAVGALGVRVPLYLGHS